jgi:hypothetical protein
MKEFSWPYNLPIWRAFYRAASPDGRRDAQIDPAIEVSMGNPTSGLLCVTGGPHIEKCNPSFVWSDDSRYLAVPQYFTFFGRQRVLILSFAEKRVFASKETAWYFQPESFSGGQLVVTIDPFRSPRTRGAPARVRRTEEWVKAYPPPALTFQIPSELSARFTRLSSVHWPQSSLP